jgi:imidazolonepropionase
MSFIGRVDRLWRRARIATMLSGGAPFGLIEDGAVAARDGRIAWAGPAAALPGDIDAAETIDLGGRLVTPGLIDCHTHLVFAGDRAREFELRLVGASYVEIARAGGGIASTVRLTRAADDATLLREALPRLDALIEEGVTTIEIKSGYGLDRDNEIKLLRVARQLGTERPVTVSTSFLGAHALPQEFADRPDDFIDAVCADMLPAAARAGLVDAVDGFVERIGFTAAQMRRVFTVARALGLPVRLHAEQLSLCGGAALAAEFGALSADHLEHEDEAGVAALARAGTVAVLLPGAYYFLRESQKPPVALLRRHGVPIAVATDCNPGSSPLSSLLLALNMACTLFRLTPEEALAGATRHAARALGMAGETGTIEPGKWCDFCVWDVEQPAELAYRIGFNPLERRIWRGQ